jgi:hypothetical protein
MERERERREETHKRYWSQRNIAKKKSVVIESKVVSIASSYLFERGEVCV